MERRERGRSLLKMVESANRLETMKAEVDGSVILVGYDRVLELSSQHRDLLGRLIKRLLEREIVTQWESIALLLGEE